MEAVDYQRSACQHQTFWRIAQNLEGTSQRVLTQNLRELENDGLIKRKVYAEVPPRVEYSLNELGRSLLPIISTMANWGNNYKKRFRTNDLFWLIITKLIEICKLQTKNLH